MLDRDPPCRRRYATYATPALYSIQSLRLTPPSFEGQRVVSWRVEVPGIERRRPLPRRVRQHDAISSPFRAPHAEIAIIARGTVETQDRRGIVRGLPEVAPPRVFCGETPKTAPDEAIRELAAGLKAADRHRPPARADGRRAATGRLRDRRDQRAHERRRGARPAAASARTTPTSSFRRRALLGVPARYVNGYFVTGGESASEAQHAWAEAWVDGLGWVGFDPANHVCPTERYVRLACGLDAASAAPIRGTRRGGETRLLTSWSKSSSKQRPAAVTRQTGALGHGSSLGTLPMTYCVALRLDRGLVFAADTRTNAGVDNVAQYRKLHFWRKPGERVIVLLSAGNLAVTQSVVSMLERAAREREDEPDAANLFNVPSMYRAARLVGDAVREHPGDRRRGARDEQDRLYRPPSSSAARSAPSGRACSRSTPKAISSRRPTTRRSFQIGEHKYGKPILDRVARPTCGSARRRS